MDILLLYNLFGDGIVTALNVYFQSQTFSYTLTLCKQYYHAAQPGNTVQRSLIMEFYTFGKYFLGIPRSDC